jgi:hypothetical protein
MFLGVAVAPRSSNKAFLLLDAEPYSYLRTLSDIAGSDVAVHRLEPQAAAAHVSAWLAVHSRDVVPGAASIWREYRRLQAERARLSSDCDTPFTSAGFSSFVRLARRAQASATEP